MGKSEQAALDDNHPVTLDEFCILLSQTDRRVELISAFAASETRGGTVKDFAPSFQARFTAFANRPV